MPPTTDTSTRQRPPLLGIGKRNKKLNTAAGKVAKVIVPIHFSDGDKKCEPMDILKHLTSDYLRAKLGA